MILLRLLPTRFALGSKLCSSSLNTMAETNFSRKAKMVLFAPNIEEVEARARLKKMAHPAKLAIGLKALSI
jgi:hypothetical protein